MNQFYTHTHTYSCILILKDIFIIKQRYRTIIFWLLAKISWMKLAATLYWPNFFFVLFKLLYYESQGWGINNWSLKLCKTNCMIYFWKRNGAGRNIKSKKLLSLRNQNGWGKVRYNCGLKLKRHSVKAHTQKAHPKHSKVYQY